VRRRCGLFGRGRWGVDGVSSAPEAKETDLGKRSNEKSESSMEGDDAEKTSLHHKSEWTSVFGFFRRRRSGLIHETRISSRNDLEGRKKSRREGD